MSFGSKIVANGTYFRELQSRFPQLQPEDMWSLICCGSDLHHPYEGWAGVVAYPIYAEAAPFTLFFSEFTEQLMAWENVPEFRIEHTTSKVQAFADFRAYITSVTTSPVFVSANAATWALRVIQDAVRNDSGGPWSAQLICLRDLYSRVSNHLPLQPGDFIGQSFQHAPPLPKTFGLHKIAAVLDVNIPELSDKATHKAQLTAACSYKLLEEAYPGDSDD